MASSYLNFNNLATITLITLSAGIKLQCVLAKAAKKLKLKSSLPQIHEIAFSPDH